MSRLVLLGATVLGALRRGVAPEHVRAMTRLIEDGWGQDNPALRQLFTSQFWPSATVEEMNAINHLQRMSCSPQAAACLVRRIAELDASGDMADVRCPTLVLHNPRDVVVPFEVGRLAASTIPGARLEPFDSAGHTPLVGEPAFDRVNRLIEEFVLAGEDAERPARPSLWTVPAGPGDPSV